MPVEINFEWVARRRDQADSEAQCSLVVRLTRADQDDLLSRYTPGSPVDTADALAFYEAFIQAAYAQRTAEPEIVG